MRSSKSSCRACAREYNELRPVGSDRDLRVDVRLIAAANEPLGRLSGDGTFLSDLYARLSVFSVRLPSLRERRADIPILVESYLQSHAQRLRIPKPTVDSELMYALQHAPWPNNLRQLEATTHRLLLEADGASTINRRHCLGSLAFLSSGETRRETTITQNEIADAFEKAGTVGGAAKLLGVHRTTVYRAQRRQGRADQDIAG